MPEVSGTVVDVFSGQPIDAATCRSRTRRARPHTYSVGTDKTGGYKFTSTADQADRGRGDWASQREGRPCPDSTGLTK